MNRLVILCIFFTFIFSGCNKKTEHPEIDRNVFVSFSIKSFSDAAVKTKASAEEEAVDQVLLFAVNEKGDVVGKYPFKLNLLSDNIQLTVSSEVKLLYAVANPSDQLKVADPSTLLDLLALTKDFSNAPVSPLIMSGLIGINSGNQFNIELTRAVAKIVISGEGGFLFQSVTVKNTPVKGFVFMQKTFTIPSSDRVVYSEISNSTVYVAENSATSSTATTLTVTGSFNGHPVSVDIDFTVNNTLVPIERNKCYLVNLEATPGHDYDFSIEIVDWDEVDVDTHYFDY